MSESNLERLGAVAGLVASLSVGVPVLLDQLRGDGDLLSAPLLLWAASYAGYLAAFILSVWLAERVSWLGERRLLAVQVVTGGAAVAMAPALGWMPVLLVVTTVTAAMVLSVRGTAIVIAGHSALLAVVWVLARIDMTEVLLGVLVYGSLQVFAVLMVWSSQREATARARLAEANMELRAATVLLAESSRAGERLRIARELHDLVGHQLTALALELEVASHRTGPPGSDHVTRARRIAKDLLSDVRAAVGELRTRPPPLRSALEALATDLPRPRVHLEVADDIEVDGERTTTLVRCVQEIITNAVRHSGADNLWIEITSSAAGETVLRARDDGCGTPALQMGNGLTGMRERVEQLGGEVSFDHERGFRVVAEVPAP